MLEFCFLTPLPGSEDHQKLARAGVPLDPDMNKYDLSHVCGPHPRMSRAEWERAYKMAWETYYTDEHIATVLRRLVATRSRPGNAVLLLAWFKGSIGIENVHPLEAGAIRFKFRRDRRPGLPIVPVWRFYPAYVAETLKKLMRWLTVYARLRTAWERIKRDPNRFEYSDLAITAPTDDETE